jgi:hypothetical protein
MPDRRCWISPELEGPLLELLAQPGGYYGVMDTLMHIAEELAGDCRDIRQDRRRADAYGALAMAIKRTQKSAMRVMSGDLGPSDYQDGKL